MNVLVTTLLRICFFVNHVFMYIVLSCFILYFVSLVSFAFFSNHRCSQCCFLWFHILLLFHFFPLVFFPSSLFIFITHAFLIFTGIQLWYASAVTVLLETFTLQWIRAPTKVEHAGWIKPLIQHTKSCLHLGLARRKRLS